MCFEKQLIVHCSPTLAGLKTANLFSCSINGADIIMEKINEWNEKLNDRGIYLAIIRMSQSRGLVYVYRKSMLEMDLRQTGVREFLETYSYRTLSVEDSLSLLRKRFIDSECFPHEIGIFLGYPLHDVIGFIENEGKNCSYCGCWKVYGDPGNAQKLFAKYKKCKKVYVKLFANGRSIMQLTVAA